VSPVVIVLLEYSLTTQLEYLDLDTFWKLFGEGEEFYSPH